jgi:hypothetical protein
VQVEAKASSLASTGLRPPKEPIKVVGGPRARWPTLDTLELAGYVSSRLL